MKQKSFNNKAYWEERLKMQYNLLGVGDISLTLNYNFWSYKVTGRRLKAVFNKYSFQDTGTVVDIGSGTGFVVDIWNKMNKKIIGLDISPTAVKKLAEKYINHQFIEIDAGKEELPFMENSIQVVSASSVLYHIVDDTDLQFLLNSIHRILQPNGYFIFSDNFIHEKVINITHQKCRSLEEYEQMLKSNGFLIVGRVANYVLFNDPVDASNKFFPRVWNLLTLLSRKWKWFDAIIWPLLFPIELLLTAIIKESPAQEIMICKVIK